MKKSVIPLIFNLLFHFLLLQLVLRGEAKRTERAGLTLPPVDLEANAAEVLQRFGPVPGASSASSALDARAVGPAEQGMSYLMYPKVYEDYRKALQQKGGVLVRHLPTPVYQHVSLFLPPPSPFLPTPCFLLFMLSVPQPGLTSSSPLFM